MDEREKQDDLDRIWVCLDKIFNETMSIDEKRRDRVIYFINKIKGLIDDLR